MQQEWIATLAQTLSPIGSFSDEHLRLIANRVQPRSIAKNAVLLAKGTVCQSIYYSLEGAFYQQADDDQQEPVILDLHLPNQWFFNQQSLVAQCPSVSTIQAYSAGAVLELTLPMIHQLVAISPIFLQLSGLLHQATDRLHFFDQKLTPAQKYQYLLDVHPQLLHTFPLHMIAAYLKITPETLSRVRQQLARGLS